MSDTEKAGTPASPYLADFSDYFAKEAAHNRRAAELRPANKAALFGALAGAGITAVVVSFDGYGDSGQIESIDSSNADGQVDLPDEEMELASPVYGSDEVQRKTMLIRDAVERLSYDLLEELYGGWENNDGAYGEFTFDVAKRSITLDYNGRYTAVESYSHEW